MAKNFKELRAKMSSEAQKRAEQKAQRLKLEICLPEELPELHAKRLLAEALLKKRTTKSQKRTKQKTKPIFIIALHKLQ